jgi:hypothetical protein
MPVGTELKTAETTLRTVIVDDSALARLMLRDALSAERIAYWLDTIAQEAPSPDAESSMYWFEEELSLIASGMVAGSRDEVVRDMDQFLTQHGERPT